MDGSLIVAHPWKLGAPLQPLSFTQVPIWFRIENPGIPWTRRHISSVASTIGRPVDSDDFSVAAGCLGDARVCIEMKCDSKLPKETMVEVDSLLKTLKVETVAKPATCSNFKSFGHKAPSCLQKTRKAPPENDLQVRLGKLLGARDNAKKSSKKFSMAGQENKISSQEEIHVDNPNAADDALRESIAQQVEDVVLSGVRKHKPHLPLCDLEPDMAGSPPVVCAGSLNLDWELELSRRSRGETSSSSWKINRIWDSSNFSTDFQQEKGAVI